MPRVSQIEKLARARDVIAGLGKRFSPGTKYSVNGKVYTTGELIAIYQQQVDALEAIRIARAALNAAVAKERAIGRRVRGFTLVLKQTVRNHFGLGPLVIADFGWRAPKRPGPKTAEAKAAGAEKARATREARGTMGKRQRRKIRG